MPQKTGLGPGLWALRWLTGRAGRQICRYRSGWRRLRSAILLRRPAEPGAFLQVAPSARLRVAVSYTLLRRGSERRARRHPVRPHRATRLTGNAATGAAGTSRPAAVSYGADRRRQGAGAVGTLGSGSGRNAWPLTGVAATGRQRQACRRSVTLSRWSARRLQAPGGWARFGASASYLLAGVAASGATGVAGQHRGPNGISGNQAGRLGRVSQRPSAT